MGGGTGGEEGSLGFLLGHLYWMYCKLPYNKNIACLRWVYLGGRGNRGKGGVSRLLTWSPLLDVL